MLERIIEGELDHRGGREMDILFEVNGKPYRMHLDVEELLKCAVENDMSGDEPEGSLIDSVNDMLNELRNL